MIDPTEIDDEAKKECRKFIQKYKWPKGKLSRIEKDEIFEAYRVVFPGSDKPPMNMMPESRYEEDPEEVYHRVLLDCILQGKPYRLPKEEEEEWKKLDELGIPYD